MGIFSKKPQVTKDQVIKVKGLEAAMSSLKKLGANEKTARTKINKALRPAAMKAVKSLKSKYKSGSKNKVPGQRYDASTKSKSVGKSIADSIGIITAKRSKDPGLFVGTRLKHLNQTWVKGKKSRNLPAMLVNGTKERTHKNGKSVGRIKNQPNYYKEVMNEKGSNIASTAERDVSKMLDRMFKQAGFK
jgi:hypothetical protein|tara:strand:+ start:434 stop:1000 length:567 start_codon:yes stop_codon:yes gene_type:complete